MFFEFKSIFNSIHWTQNLNMYTIDSVNIWNEEFLKKNYKFMTHTCFFWQTIKFCFNNKTTFVRTRPRGFQEYARARTINNSNTLQDYQLYDPPPAVTRLTVYCRAHISLVGWNRSSKNMCGRFCCCFFGKTWRCLAHKIIILEQIHDFACFQIQINFWLGSLDSEPTNVYYR